MRTTCRRGCGRHDDRLWGGAVVRRWAPPAGRLPPQKLFSMHPPTAERVARLRHMAHEFPGQR